MQPDLSWFKGKLVERPGQGAGPHNVEVVTAFLSSMGILRLGVYNPLSREFHVIDAEGVKFVGVGVPSPARGQS
jgi:hypothetical protein